MSKEHFRNLKKIYTEEGLSQAIKYDFDKSFFRLAIPYAVETIPGMLFRKNYQTLMENTIDDTKFDKVFAGSIMGMLSLGSECARYLTTAVTYNETKSLEASLLAYSLSSSFFSMRNLLRCDRFYKSTKETV
jgi:hypothetical protein